MRVALFIAFVILIGGCSLPPAARREVALLKNEIIDWQNQYYALKSEYVRATGCEPQLDGFSPAFEGDLIVEPPPGGAIETILGRSSSTAANPSPSDPGLEIASQSAPDVHTVAPSPSTADLTQGRDEGFRTPRVPGAHLNQSTQHAPSATGDRETEATLVNYSEESPSPLESSQPSNDSSRVPAINVVAERYWESQSPGTESPQHLRVQAGGLPAAAEIQGPDDALQVSVLDLTRPAGEQRIGFWSLSPMQLGVLQERNDLNNAIDLLLPWPTDTTDSSQIRLFFRIRAADGRWIEQSADVATAVR